MSLSRAKDADPIKYASITTCLALSRAVYAKDNQSCLVSEVIKFSFCIA